MPIPTCNYPWPFVWGNTVHVYFILSAYLILPVMALSLAVLFHRDIMSSVGLTEITAPHISLPTINCSPSIASSCDSRKIASQQNTTICPLNECSEPILRTPHFHLDTILYPSCPRGTLEKLSLSIWLTSFQKFELRSFTHLGSSCLVPGYLMWISRSFLPQFRTFDALIFCIKPSWWSLIHLRIDEYYYRYTCKSRLSSR